MARPWKSACLVAVARGQRQNLLPAGCPVFALAAVSAPRVPVAGAPRGAADTTTGGEGVNGIGPTQQMENFIMK